MDGYLETCDLLDSRQFVVAVKRLADAFNFGTDRSPFLGSGIEFVQSRPYIAGDSVRAIDWRVSARMGKFFVKEYEAPKQMPCYLLLDTSASMAISSQRLSKYAIAVHLAGGLAFACLNRVSPVGVIGIGTRELRVQPTLSTPQVFQWLHLLRRYRYDEETAVGRRISELAPALTSRSVVIVLSDLHDPTALPALKLLAQRHDCAVLQLQDPAEKGLRGSGFLRAREAETGRPFVAHGRSRWDHAVEPAEQLRQAGIDHLLIETNQRFVEKVRLFFRSRNLLGRGAR